MNTAFFQHLHCRLETLAFFAAHELAGRHAAVLKNHVGRVGTALAHFLIDLANGDARCAGFHDEGRHTARTFVGRVGARHQREDTRVRRIGDVALGAVDDVVFAIRIGALDGGGTQRRGIRAGIGLGQCERRHQFTRGQARQVFGLLLGCAVKHNTLRANTHRGAKQ